MAWNFYDANGTQAISQLGTMAIARGGTGATSASAALTALGVGTGDSPQFLGINVGAASDTTITRTGAGVIAVEGSVIYKAGGTDVPVADGGTGLGSYTQGDIVYYDSGITLSKLNNPGTPAGEVLTFATGATAPTWVAASAGVSLGLVIALGG